MASKIGGNWRELYPTINMQAEFFLLKFNSHPDITRDKVLALAKDFKTFDRNGNQNLEEDEALMLFEHRKETKTFLQVIAMVKDSDVEQTRLRSLSFLEWACAAFSKSWKELHAPTVDPEELAAAMAMVAEAERAAEAAAAEEEAKRLEAEAASATESEKKALEARAAAARAAAKQAQNALNEQIERTAAAKQRAEAEAKAKRDADLGQAGLKGMTAKFHYAAADTRDTTKDNEAAIKQAARERREKKEAEAASQKAAADAEAARQEAERAAAEKARADAAAAAAEAERQRAEEEKRRADEEKRKAEEGSEASRRQQEAYDRAKREQEEAEAKKAADEAADRARRRAAMAERAKTFLPKE